MMAKGSTRGDSSSPANPSAITACLTVVVPCFNEQATVVQLIDKVLASPWVPEVVVVDDGSTDGTRDELAGVDDPRVQIVNVHGVGFNLQVD